MYIVNFRMLKKALAGIFDRRYFRPGYLLFIGPLTVSLLLLRFLILPFQLLDYVLFPKFRQVRVDDPVFILSGPRSGSTFLHRLMVCDEQFVSLKLWHTLFPSVTIFKIVNFFATLEQKSPLRPIEAFWNFVDKLSFGGWDNIHKTGLRFYEEDEHLWVQIFASPIGLVLFYPFLYKYQDVISLDKLPLAQRKRLSGYYLRMIQRFMYLHPDKTYLAKNAVSGGRIGLYKAAMPDMKVIYINRNTAETIPSSLSMFTKPWTLHSPQCYGESKETMVVVEALIRNLMDYEKFVASGEVLHKSEIRYNELVSNPYELVLRVYDDLELNYSDDFEAMLRENCNAAKSYKSKHKYSLDTFGISPHKLSELQEEILG